MFNIHGVHGLVPCVYLWLFVSCARFLGRLACLYLRAWYALRVQAIPSSYGCHRCLKMDRVSVLVLASASPSETRPFRVSGLVSPPSEARLSSLETSDVQDGLLDPW